MYSTLDWPRFSANMSVRCLILCHRPLISYTASPKSVKVLSDYFSTFGMLTDVVVAGWKWTQVDPDGPRDIQGLRSLW